MDPQQRAALILRDKDKVWHPYTQMSSYRQGADPLLIVSAQGARLHEADGRTIIDGNSSWWTSLLGHNHPRLVATLAQQASRLCHVALGGMTHEPAVEFAEAFAAVCPPGLSHVFFSDNGSTAVEAALKMATQFWQQQSQNFPQKHEFLALKSAFHGETLGATALGDVGAFQVPLAGARRATTHLTSPADDWERSLHELEQQLRTRADHIAALVIEPLIQGAGGMKMYEPSYLKEARLLTSHHDVLLIVDEVFTGYGRTGQFWACDHAAITPDILCSAKGLSGGILPFAATVTTDRVFEAFLGERSRAFMYGHTFCGNPLGAAVAREVLRVYQDEQILLGTVERAQLISASIARLAERPHVHNARSLGMCGAVNLGQGGDYLSDVGWRVYQKALSRGAYLRPLGDVVYVAPPLNIPISDLHELLSVFESSVAEVLDEQLGD